MYLKMYITMKFHILINSIFYIPIPTHIVETTFEIYPTKLISLNDHMQSLRGGGAGRQVVVSHYPGCTYIYSFLWPLTRNLQLKFALVLFSYHSYAKHIHSSQCASNTQDAAT